jgi:hypothetical protein
LLEQKTYLNHKTRFEPISGLCTTQVKNYEVSSFYDWDGCAAHS